MLSSISNIYEKKDRILRKITFLNDDNEKKDLNNFSNGNNKFWFEELRKGGYIIYMRHTERNKWHQTNMYDSAEMSESRRGEKEYFAEFVCLNEKGKIQAKMINEFIKKHGMKIGTVISSPSCRARQTAEIAFNKLDLENKLLAYKGVFYDDYNSEEYNNWQKDLKNLILNLPVDSDKNTIITGHNSILIKKMFDNQEALKGIDLPSKVKEGGFYVFSTKNGALNFEHQFTNFTDFSVFTHKRK